MFKIVAILLLPIMAYSQEGRVYLALNNRSETLNTDFGVYGEKYWKNIGARISSGYQYRVLMPGNMFYITTTGLYRTEVCNIAISPAYFYWNAETKHHKTPISLMVEKEFPEARFSIGFDNSPGYWSMMMYFSANLFKLKEIHR